MSDEKTKTPEQTVAEAHELALQAELDGKVKAYIADFMKEHRKDAETKAKEQDKSFLASPDQQEAVDADALKTFGKGPRAFGRWLSAVWASERSGKLDPRLVKSFVVGKAPAQSVTGHESISDDSMGGFLVPEIYRMELQELAIEDEVVRRAGPMIIPMATDVVKIPYVADTSHVSSLFGGVIAYWTAEAAQKSGTGPTFGQMELTPHKLAGITYASNELLADSAIALEPLLKRQFAKAWAWNEDYAFLRGSGAGMPLGVLNCGCLNAVYRAVVNHISYDDIAKMYARMLPTSLNKAVWVCNPSVIPELITMGLEYLATEYARILVFQPDAKLGVTWQLLGRPVFITEKLPEMGTASDLIFGDFSYYLIGDRQPITIDASTHLRFDYDETAWRFVLRVAGQCWPQTKLTLKSGTSSYSPFVSLAATTS